MIFNQKINALAMLGSVDDISNISGPLQSKGISILKKNFVSTEDLITAIRKEKNIEYVFLSDSGMLGVREGIYTVPMELAELKRDLYIVIFFNMGKYNQEYLKWAAGLGIQSIYFMNDTNYTDEAGAFDFNKILREVKEKKRIFSTPEKPSESQEPPKANAPKVIKVEVEKEVIREIEVPVEVEKIVEKEVIREIRVPVETQGRRPLFGRKQASQSKSTKIIGVHASSSGVGATGLCVNYAKFLSAKGYNVAILERNDQGHLKGYKEKGIDIYGTPLNELDINSYDYILLDFGVLYVLSRKAPVMITDTREEIQERQLKYGIERKYCTNTVMVCPTSPWRIGEVQFFLEDIAADNTRDWLFYFNGDPSSKEFKKQMNDYFDEERMIVSYENKTAFEQLYKIINR